MDLRILEKSPDLTPFLVRLYDSQNNYDHTHNQNPEAGTELAGVIGELVEKDMGPFEQEMVSDLLISLLRQAEKDLRQALAQRLSTIENAPLRVILHIANDEISVARPVLQTSSVLSDLDLLYIIKGKSPEYWQAIASRKNLSNSVMDVLAETRDAKTAHVLAGNTDIRLTLKAANIIGTMAEGDENLARPLLMRSDLPEEIARHLYAYVGQELKSYIKGHFGDQGQQFEQNVDDVLFEFVDSSKTRKFMPTENMMIAAKAMAEAGHLTMISIMAPLERGQYASFIAMFSQLSGLSAEDSYDLFSDSSARMLAITCRALGLSKGELARIYMMTQRIRSEDRIVDHQELMRAISTFENITVEKARAATHIFSL